MSLSRRDFLRLGGVTAVAASATACSAVGRQVAQGQLPETLTPPRSSSSNPLWRLLNRAGYGPRPGSYEEAQEMGFAAYLEQQLHPDAIEDTAADLFLRNLSLYQMDIDQLLGQEERDAALELTWATAVRAIYSRRQLYEAMVAFWTDHFNIYLRKNEVMPFLKLVDDRDVIRPHALGRFSDLLTASAHSPAMLVYLDNVRNVAGDPNENYARELLELHTLGVNGGYTQQDVQELARALTGWTVGRRGRSQGKFQFVASQHDHEAKSILGRTLPAGQGAKDVEEVLAMLAAHPATAEFIATKLVRRFVADDSPPELVAQVAQTFLQTDGDIKSMLRVIFLSAEFAAAPPKLKRPFTFMVSALRAVGADVGLSRELGNWLRRLGQPLFQWPPPDGYPDTANAWAANLLPRWNFAQALVNQGIPRTRAPLADLAQSANARRSSAVLALFAGLTLGRTLTPDEAQPLAAYVGSEMADDPATRQRLRDAVALLLASPAFQWT